MKTTQLAMLAGAALVVGGLAYWSQQRGTPVLTERATQGVLLPGLADKINDIHEIALKKGKDSATLKRVNNDWTIVEKSGYRANFENVKQLALNLAALQKFEAKSSKPEHYKALGVADPAADNDVAASVELKDAAGKPLASLIVGGTRGGFGGAAAEATVRVPGDPQVWQARGQAVINADPLSWLQRTILEVSRDRVKQVTITPSVTVETGAGPSTDMGSRVLITRETPETPNFSVADVPPGRELSSPSAGDGIGAALSYVTFDDVKPAAEMTGVPPVAVAEYRTFDGLVLKATTYKKETAKEAFGWFVTFSANYEEPPAAAPTPPAAGADGTTPTAATPAAASGKSREDVNKEVATINSALGGWAFMLPEFKAKQMSDGMASLLKALEAPKQPTPAGPALPTLEPSPMLEPAPKTE